LELVITWIHQSTEENNMIIDLVDKLIERCLQLAKHHREVNRNLFSDFVDPIYSQMEEIHKNYLDSFQKYRALIKSTNEPFDANHQILDLIREEHLFSEGRRLKILELSRINVSSDFARLIWSICLCLTDTQLDIIDDHEQFWDYYRDIEDYLGNYIHMESYRQQRVF
jgi:hypothetical protein